MGVVYHGNYLRFFEIARTEMLRSLGLPYAELESSGYMLPVLESYAEYLVPARYDDEIVLHASIPVEMTVRLTISYIIERDGVTLATGWTRHAFVKADTFAPTRPPKHFLDIVQGAVS
jgi:acyl-CoA thioester hydrolase